MPHGFSLIQISLLLTVASLALLAILPTPIGNAAAIRLSTERMNAILSSLRQFEAANARIPCPSDASLPSGAAGFGIEASGNGATGNCSGATPAANAVDATNHIAIGGIPVRSLGLAGSYATDAWGRSFTYAADTRATQCFLGSLSGGITVTDQGSPMPAVGVIVSHGKDGHGAWVPIGGQTGSAVRLNSGAGDADELLNAHVDSGFQPIQPLTGFTRKPANAAFTGLVAYRNPQWNLGTLPNAAASLFPVLGVPAPQTYIAGQTFAFSLTYPAAVNVSGTPRLALTIGSTTRYANYLSGSGSASLIFSYTLQAADYAPSGITLSPAVDTALGSTGAPCNSFSVPSLTGVLVKKLIIYVTDYANNRVQAFDAFGNYVTKFGSIGTAGGQFISPRQPLADSSGAIWISDWGNSRVEKFSPAGIYQGALGLPGIGNGQFVNTGSLAFDAVGNLWVADEGNNRLQKFSAGGAYMAKFGAPGIGNGQFVVPTGIAIDATGNLWVGDWGNNRIQKFTSSGTYISQLGGLGSGNGRFFNPCGEAFDGSGNLWVVDNGNNRLQKFDGNGSYLMQFGTFGAGGGQFFNPCGVAIDVAGNLWVGDGGNNRIQKFNAGGSYLGQVGTYGTGLLQFHTPSNVGLLYQ